mmetsp:Transcript_19544/g.56025  ORF Transcript_19544/g.56025 Transcript_19544/m.56025 type:complete len:214 (-) Transcript_19544:528-1169(-)
MVSWRWRVAARRRCKGGRQRCRARPHGRRSELCCRCSGVASRRRRAGGRDWQGQVVRQGRIARKLGLRRWPFQRFRHGRLLARGKGRHGRGQAGCFWRWPRLGWRRWPRLGLRMGFREGRGAGMECGRQGELDRCGRCLGQRGRPLPEGRCPGAGAERTRSSAGGHGGHPSRDGQGSGPCDPGRHNEQGRLQRWPPPGRAHVQIPGSAAEGAV